MTTSATGGPPGAAGAVGISVALVSAKGAPGVTTTALLLSVLLAGSVLVEADPAGGDLRCSLAAAADPPLRADLGVVSLLASHRTGLGSDPAGSSLLQHAQVLPGGQPVLVGPGTRRQASALAPAWPQLAHAVRAHPGLVLLDLGRCDTHTPSWSLVEACAMTLVVTRAHLAAVAHTRDLLGQLRQRSMRCGLLVIGTERQHRDATDALGGRDTRDPLGDRGAHANSLAWTGRLPDDPPSAAQLLGGEWTRRLDRSPLLAYGRRTAASLRDALVTAHTAAAVGAATEASIPHPTDPEQTWASGVPS